MGAPLKGNPEADALHRRLCWVLEHADQSLTEIAERMHRQKGSIQPWFAAGDTWILPDARGIIGLLKAVTIKGMPLRADWLLLAKGPVAALPERPAELYYRAADAVLAEVDLGVTELRTRLKREEAAVRGEGSPASNGGLEGAAARVTETDRRLLAGKKRGRRTG
jgi:hypothetical protein